MKTLNERLKEIDDKIHQEQERHYLERNKLDLERQNTIKNYYKEVEALKKKKFALLVKKLSNDLLQNQYIVRVMKSRKPFEIIIERSKDIKHVDLYRLLKHHSKMSWITSQSGIPNITAFTLTDKDREKLETSDERSDRLGYHEKK